jgi:hypothetical protein
MSALTRQRIESPDERESQPVIRRVRRYLPDRAVLVCGLISFIVLAPASGWGIPRATSEVTVRGWEVDAISGIGVLSELSNLAGASRPDWYVAYPLFHYLVLGFAYVPYIAFATLTGRLRNPGGEFPYGFTDPVQSLAALNAIGHAVTVLMGAITIMALFVLARRIFNTRAAVLAAALALCSAPFMFYARTGNLDVPALCWTMLCFVALERCWSDGLTVPRAVACGAFAAFAVATKDQSYGVLLVPLVALLVRSWRTPGPATTAQRIRLPLVLVGSGVIAFLLASGIVLRPDRFVRHLQYITNFRDTFTNVRYQTELTVMRGTGVAERALLVGDMLRATGTAVGWPVVVMGLAGFVALWRSVPSIRWMVAAMAGFFLLVLVPIQHMQYRYALAPAVLLALSAAALTVRLTSRPVALGAMTIVLLAPAIAGAAEITHAMLTDARGPASDWLSRRVAAGDTLGYFGRPHQLPYIPAGVRVEQLQLGGAETRLNDVRPRWVVVAPDYFADRQRERSIFLPLAVYQGLRDGSMGWTLVARFESPGLLGRPLPYLPYVNPVVQVYKRRDE